MLCRPSGACVEFSGSHSEEVLAGHTPVMMLYRAAFTVLSLHQMKKRNRTLID